jgi:hypothetical protein
MDGHQHFGRTSCVDLQFCFNSERGGSNFLRNLQTYLTKLNSVTSHNTSVTFIIVRTSKVSLFSFENWSVSKFSNHRFLLTCVTVKSELLNTMTEFCNILIMAEEVGFITTYCQLSRTYQMMGNILKQQ